MLWEDALEGYWLARRRDFSRYTVRGYAQVFREFGAHVGPAMHVERISREQVRAFLNGMAARGLADKTILNAWVALSSFWSWAEADLGAAHVIRAGVQKPKARRPQIDPYSAQEVAAILAQVELGNEWETPAGKRVRSKRPTAARDRAILLVLLDAGLRAQELCDLTVGDVDLKTGKARVRHGKGDKERLVWLGEAARKAIWRSLLGRKGAGAGEPLFCALRGAQCRPLEVGNVRHIVQRIAARAGVEGANLHKFRHTFAIAFLRNGGSVLALQALLGHESLSTVRIYARLAEVDLREAHQRASPADNWKL